MRPVPIGSFSFAKGGGWRHALQNERHVTGFDASFGQLH